jgi:glyoxylase-like metal-dependent hydrolase (beta-lactamase superfamily II)
MKNMHRIAVGEGSPEGTNSAYVLPDLDAVIDPGPAGDASWKRLVSGFEDIDVTLSEISSVFVTHWHMDHAGLAPRLAEESDATLYMHENDASLVGDYALERTKRLDHDARMLTEWGVPGDVINAIQTMDDPTPVPDEFPVRPLSDGDHISGLEVIHTPGHTLGHAAFAADALFVGDAVLPTYTPNIGGSDTRTENPLETYLWTLRRLRSRVEEETAYPGHGVDLDLNGRIDEIRSHHERRSRRIHALVVEHERVTPWEIATSLFGEMRGIHAKMGAGEAAAHLTHLDAIEYVERVADNPDTFVPARTDTPDKLTLQDIDY